MEKKQAPPQRGANLTLADVYDKLVAPFGPGDEKYRIGYSSMVMIRGWKWAKPLPYIDARAVFDRLDEVVGPDNWSTDMEQLDGGAVICRLTVLGITKTDKGIVNVKPKVDFKSGEVKELTPEETEMAEKGSVSDAVKRAAVQFGIGRCLYAMDLPLTPLVSVGNKWFLPDDYLPPCHGGPEYDPKTLNARAWLEERDRAAGNQAPEKPRQERAQQKPREEPRDEGEVKQFDQIQGSSISKGRLGLIRAMLVERGLTEADERTVKWLKSKGKETIEDLTNDEGSVLVEALKGVGRINKKASHGR